MNVFQYESITFGPTLSFYSKNVHDHTIWVIQCGDDMICSLRDCN